MTTLRIGIIGDFDSQSYTHQATNAALHHAAAALSIHVEPTWLPTLQLETPDRVQRLQHYHALWAAPGSPYHSLEGAVQGIRFAREHDRPFFGTWGGFQHALVEYARHVLGIAQAQHEEVEPQATCLVVNQLTCSLVGQTATLQVAPGSRAAALYGKGEVTVSYLCNYGLNPAFRDAMIEGGMRITGNDANGEVRMVELPQHPFYMATLFLPQATSVPETPDPLIVGYLQAAMV